MNSGVYDLKLSLTPEDISSIGNSAMLAHFRDHSLDLTEEIYFESRNMLFEADTPMHRKCRVGSIYGAALANWELIWPIRGIIFKQSQSRIIARKSTTKSSVPSYISVTTLGNIAEVILV